MIGKERPVRYSLGSEIGLAHFGVETEYETKPNLPNSADRDTVSFGPSFLSSAAHDDGDKG